MALTIAFCFACSLTGATFWFLLKTDLGRFIRAVAQDAEAASLMDVNAERIRTITMGMGAGLVAA